jgi:diguanylate cyclase (GGDEF)-like protein
MSNADPSFHEKLRLLGEEFIASLPDKLAAIESAWQQLNLRQCNAIEVRGLARMFHTLAGTAPYFKFAALAAAARQGEKLLKKGMEDTSTLTAERSLIEVCIEDLKRACSELESASTAIEDRNAAPTPAPAVAAHHPAKKVIFLGENDANQGSRLALEIGCFGYEVKVFNTFPTLSSALQTATPAAIIMNLFFSDRDRVNLDITEAMQFLFESHIPTIFLSRRNDFQSRLRAVQAGGDAYFLKPIKIGDLVDKLDLLTAEHISPPYRILIIDDDLTVSQFHAALLEARGMKSRVINDPLQLFQHLNEFNPDLILMDLTMPGCDSYQLARLIRQIPAYVSIPIVFLSVEHRLEKKLQALGTGGDDFLTKPIQPEHLISSIIIRAERMRMLRSLMEKDGLTGLYNHTAFENFLDHTLMRASRQQIRFALAILDLDHFKQVNDSYGHAVGDAVLVVIARLLQQRLRQTDIIGRIGGEEFAIILNDIDLDVAWRVMDDLRLRFSQIRHDWENGEFTVTLSCGIAGGIHYPDAVSLSKAADMALYQAKGSGRNCVVVAKQ